LLLFEKDSTPFIEKLALFKFQVRPVILSACAIVWAIRLGTFLFTRMLRDKKDQRFDEIKVNPPR
jgi:steroid 5-alpha reductase family enzyme